MAQRGIAEIVTGAMVLLLAGGFLAYAVAHSGRSIGAGYTLHAQFERIDGMGVGSDVRLAGVKIGTVTATALDPKTYEALVTLSLADTVKLPKDSSAAITSDGLLGGKYLSLSPGGDEQMIPPGGQITVTQSSVSLEELLGKFIFSVTDMVNAVTPKPGAKNGTAPKSQTP